MALLQHKSLGKNAVVLSKRQQLWPGTNMAPTVHFAPPKPTLQLSLEKDFRFGQKSSDGWVGLLEKLNLCNYC